MKYCSECGSAVSRRWNELDGRARCVCGNCGTTHYENPRVVVNCIVCCCEEVLMCRRAHEPALGQWMVPSGFLELGETLEQGAARETFEETGVCIDPRRLELYSVVNMTLIQQVAISFRVDVAEKPIISVGPECLEATFMSESEIPVKHFAWRQSMGNLPERLFSELRSREFTIQLINIGSNLGVGFESREYRIGSITSTP